MHDKKTCLYYIHASLINNEKNLCGCGADAGPTCAGAGWVRVQLVRCGAGAGTEYKLMCGFSQARGPEGRVRA